MNKKAYNKKYNANMPPEQKKRYALKRYYNMEHDDYLEMYAEQDGKCAICGDGITLYGNGNRKETAHVDHDHDTGEVRGLLCHECNSGIGHLRDDLKIVESAALYLKRGKR